MREKTGSGLRFRILDSSHVGSWRSTLARDRDRAP
jgi:hypothetical protein